MIIKNYEGVNVLRDDLLLGGSKSILMPHIINKDMKYVYASPVYGSFQIALSSYCKSNTYIICAKRKNLHYNTLKCKEYGANIIEVPYGYLSVIEKYAKEYSEKINAIKITFGANTKENKILLSERMKQVIQKLKREPQEIWVAIGSGTLVESILDATKDSKIFGVQVGHEYKNTHERLKILKYHKSFDKVSNFKAPFQSMPNYDLKAYEYCMRYKESKDVLFWNVF